MVRDVIVVGGGASGMAAAITAARRGRTVTLLEHKEKPGKKILATGNGRCNYTNLHQNRECYRGTDPSFAWNVLERFNVEETISFFKELGIYPKSKNGYLYPNSMQASSVADVLFMELVHQKVKIKCMEHVVSITKEKGIFLVETNTFTYEGKSVILSTGGCASEELGSDGSGYALAESFGHTLIPPVPALVQLRSPEKYFSRMAGIRSDVKISLYIDNLCTVSAAGELQLTDYGVSGIPVFEISTYASRALYKKKKVVLEIDFLPELTQDTLCRLLNGRMADSYKTLSESFTGLLNQKLIPVILEQAGLSDRQMAVHTGEEQRRLLSHVLKHFKVPVSGVNPLTHAQVSAGGILTAEIKEETMESKLEEGLYLTGELLDIDGTCGGYNLQWAWSSGCLAGKYA